MAQEENVTAEAVATPPTAPTPEVSGGAPESDDKTPKKDLTSIKYVGRSDVKRLTVQDLANVGATGAKMDLRWDSQNDHTVAVADVNASTLEYLRSQPDFRVF